MAEAVNNIQQAAEAAAREINALEFEGKMAAIIARHFAAYDSGHPLSYKLQAEANMQHYENTR